MARIKVKATDELLEAPLQGERGIIAMIGNNIRMPARWHKILDELSAEMK